MQAIQIVQANVDRLQQEMQAQGGWVSLQFDTIDVGGFPRRPIVSLTKPCLHYKQPVRREMHLCAKKLAIAADDYALTQFRIVLPLQGSGDETIAGVTTHYDVAADATPSLVLRLPKAEAEDAALPNAFKGFTKQKSAAQLASLPQDLFHQWALKLPEQANLRVAVAGKTKQTAFQFLSVPLLMWQPISYDVSYPLDIFFSLLAEVTAQGTLAQPILVP